VYFFHPLVWWANARLRELREEACDEMTVAALDGRRKVYGEAIVKVTEIFGYASPPLALGVMESKSPAHRRLSRILDPQLPPGRRLQWREAASILVLGAILLPSAGAQTWDTSGPWTRSESPEPVGPARQSLEAGRKTPVDSLTQRKSEESVTRGEQSGELQPASNSGESEPFVYLWRTNQVATYAVTIEAERDGETDTLSGTPSFRVRWAHADRAELLFTGELAHTRRMFPRHPFPFRSIAPRAAFPPAGPHFGRRAFGAIGGGGPVEHAVVFNHRGVPQEVHGNSREQYLPGQLSQVLVVPLPYHEAVDWDVTGQTTLLVDSEGAVELLEARETSHYRVEDPKDFRLIHRNCRVESLATIGAEPRVKLEGDFQIRFDRERGIPVAIDGTLEQLEHDGRRTIRIPITFAARLLPEPPAVESPSHPANHGPGFGLPAEAVEPIKSEQPAAENR
jgi:hypothetical protein